jgi:DNA-3-methyladenine glycosylase
MKFILPKSFYARSTIQVAQDILGKKLVRILDNGTVLSGIITETEAYQSDEPACHAHKGCTERTAPLFGPVGHAYVYFIYGNYFCLNIVAKKGVTAGGVLIRAVEPVEGVEYMQHARKTSNIKNLTTGPGKLTQAFNITKNEQGTDVTQQGSLYIARADVGPFQIVATPRIGISQAVDKNWRFYIKNNQFVSKR